MQLRYRGKYSSSLTTEALACIYDGFRSGKTVNEIQSELSEIHEHIIGERQIRNYRAQWKANDILRAKTAPVDWDNVQALVDTGVLLEHLPRLRKISYWVAKTLDVPLKNDSDGFMSCALFDFAPTYVSLRWQSYVLSYSPTVEEPFDIWVIAELYAMRDIFAEITKRPIEKDDLDGWITFTPWRDALNIFEPNSPNPLTRYKKQYLDAIRKGHIPLLKHELNRHTSNATRATLALALASIDDDITLLPSQQCKGKPPQTFVFKIRKKTFQMEIDLDF